MIAIEVKAPNTIEEKNSYLKVFLAGSIEMGKAAKWQERVTRALENERVILYNPRRDDWDSSWEQSIDNRQFRTQVEWELTHMDKADIILMYLDPETKSPISLMELGIHCTSDKLVVCCPEGFWRKGNVDVVCKWNKIDMVPSISALIEYVRKQLY